MFPARREVLKQKSGSLAETPLALLFHALLAERRTATVELKLRNLEKRVFFEEGVPVGCESNLQHETLGHSLVAKGKLTESQHHTLLAESLAAEKSLQAVLLEKQVLSAFELFKHLQATLGRTLLDAFRWVDATWKVLPPEELDAPVRLNAEQLLFTGCLQMPASVLTAHLALPASSAFGLVAGTSVAETLKLAPKEARLIQALKKGATLETLLALPGFTAEDVHRRLYALRLLELVDTQEALGARPAPAEEPVLSPMPSPPTPSAPTGLPFLDDDEAAQQLVTSEFLSIRRKDAFEVLGVDVDTQGAALQKAFLAKSSAVSPVRFRNAETRSRAEALQLAYARSYGALCEAETWQQHRARRAARDSATPKALKQKAATDAVRIRTELLDAQSQFDEGRRRLAAGQHRSAIEHFQYALDIEPRGRFLAWLAWAKYQLEPGGAQACLDLLTQASDQDPSCEEATVWRGDLAMVLGKAAEAEAAYRKAVKLAPGNPKYADALKHAQSVTRGR